MTALVVYLHNTYSNTWARLREREGQTMAEYALILGPAVRDLFKDTGSSVKKFPTS
jgi:hypothetical protein